jgi:Tol biopolymer transport system component
MDLPGGAIQRLTTHPHAEHFPRVSPDGRQVAFARSRPAWASQRRKQDWDVWLLDLAGGSERLVATNATAPSWAGVGVLVYQQSAFRVVSHDVGNGAQRVLAEAGRGALPAGVECGTPDLDAASDRLALTLRGSARMTALVEPGGRLRRVGGGCQMFWAPDRSFLYLVDDASGRMQHCFQRVDPRTLRRSDLFDAEEPWSHEYFPRISADGRWLVYGASRGGHEHDVADYEIFLWRVGDPPSKALRLTWHTGNDNWPDLWLEPGP